MKRSKPASEGGRPRRPHHQRKITLESLERRDLLATLDPTFATGGTATFRFESVGGVNAEYGSIARQADGKFVVVGSAVGPLGNRDFSIVRLNPDGSVDTTFNQGAGAKLVPFDLGGGATGNNEDRASSVVIQPDNKIVVAGLASGGIGITRLLPNGDFDRTFTEGRATTGLITWTSKDSPVVTDINGRPEVHMALQNAPGLPPDILIGAGNTVYTYNVLDGNLEDVQRVTFTGDTSDPVGATTNGSNADTRIYDLKVQPNGDVVVVGLGYVVGSDEDVFPSGAGTFNGMGIARLTHTSPNSSNLTPDFTFGTLQDYATFPDPANPPPIDQRFLQFTFSLIDRVSGAVHQANGVDVTPDGHVVLVGTESATQDGEGRLILARLTSTGVTDQTFASFGILPIETIAQGLDIAYDTQANKIVAVGYSNLPNPLRQEFAILQTDANGFVDNNFATQFGTDPFKLFQTASFNQAPNRDIASDLILLDDGRIIVAGTTQDAAITEIGLIRVLTEQPPAISVSDATVTEGDSGTTNAVFTVSLSKAYRIPVTVNIATADGTAINGTDYFGLASTPLSFAPGVTSITISIPIVGDLIDEPDKKFTINLSGAVLGTIGRGQGTGTILDNDPTPPPVPTISVSDASVTEGDSGTKDAVFTVSLSQAYQFPVTVNVATADGTAANGTDYFGLASTTLTFAPGVTSIDVAIPIIGDTTFEPDEKFVINLTGAVNGTIVRSQGTGTIVNNDRSPPPVGPGDVGSTETASLVRAERVFVQRGRRRVFVGVRLVFNGSIDPGIASQTGFYRVTQRRRSAAVNQAQVNTNSVTLILGRVSPGPLRVAFGGLISANGLPIAGGSFGV